MLAKSGISFCLWYQVSDARFLMLFGLYIVSVYIGTCDL